MENVKLFLEKAKSIMFGYSTDEEYNNREDRIKEISDIYLDNITNKLLSMDKDTRSIYAIRILKTIDGKLYFGEIDDNEQQFYQKLGDVFSDFDITLNELVEKRKKTYPSFCEGINFTSYNNSSKDEDAKLYSKGITLKRQVRAIYELLCLSGMPIDTNRVAITEFVQFLTGRNLGGKKLSDTNIYSELKRIKNTRKDRDSKKERQIYDSDIDFISDKFEKVGLGELANRLRNEKEE